MTMREAAAASAERKGEVRNNEDQMKQRRTWPPLFYKNRKNFAFFDNSARMILFCVALLALLPGCDLIPGFGSARVLFIGNSYTTTAGIPNVFAELAKSGGHKVEIGLGGGSFAAYAHSTMVRETMQ